MKFISKKVIKKQMYYYLQYKEYTQFLGKSIPENIKEKLLIFFEEIAINKFAKISQNTKKQFAFKTLKNIEKMHYWFICISQSDFFTNEYELFINWLCIHFTFNSNRSEGSKTTQKEIKSFFLSKKIKPKNQTEQEIFNSISAFKYILSDEFNWNLKSIKNVHKLLLNNIASTALIGKWKNSENVAPNNQKTTEPKNVQSEIQHLLLWLKQSFKQKKYTPLIALKFYYKFENIHPFFDGNGRTGRLLLNAILFKHIYCPIVFFTENHNTHCQSIQRAVEGREKKLNMHFVDQAKKTFNLYTTTFTK